MIERAAKCLEIGGRVALRDNRKQLRTRRHLHSAFWSHGAGNIDLPAWWIFLLQTPSDTKGTSASKRKEALRNVVSNNLENIFLDFLYPSRTLALIKRLEQSTTAHHHAAQNVQAYSRSYTTIAQDFITGADAPSVTAEAYNPPTGSTSHGETFRRLINSILDAKDPTGLHDQLWQNYQDLLDHSQTLLPQDIIRMLRCLVLSEQPLDCERALALFDSIPVEKRRAIHYSHAVSAALALKDVDMAVSTHREALSRISGSIGTAAILGYAVRQELWTVAVDTWHHFWENKLLYYTRPDIWTAVDGMSLNDLIHQASSAADFALKVSESSDGREACAAREFALELIRRAFSIVNTEFNLKSHWKLINKVRLLDATDNSIRILALKQLLFFDSREHEQLALHLYWLLRKGSGFSPPRDILEVITPKIFERSGASNVSMILDDWRTFFSTTPAQYASTAARVFARSGRLEEIQKLFNNYISEHGKPKDALFYNNMLLTYSRRADTEGAVHFFNSLQEVYDFEPGTQAWNCVLSTFARVGDIDGVLVHFRKLRDAGIKPDSTTYFLVMSIYGRRGDREAVESLYEQSRVDGVAVTIGMIDQLVLANVKEGNFDEAERLAEQAHQMDIYGSRTFMWNVLINAHALRKDVVKVSQLHRRMQELRVPYDEMTYAALMSSLTVMRYPDGARKILDGVMPRHKVKPRALHYAILMGGYCATRQYDVVFEIHKQMLRSKLKPNMSTQNALLRAAGSADKKALSMAELGTDELELPQARRVFEETLAKLDPMELAPTEPRRYVGPGSLNEAFYSSYFEYLIFLYGTENALNRASELYERYITTSVPLQSSDQDNEFIPPVRLLSALMVTHLRAKKYSEIDRCWNLALEKSERLACKSRADTFRRGWVLHSQRFIINLPLHQYILSLRDQGRITDLIDTISDLIHAGYALNSANWNVYIQTLARSPLFGHRRLAFLHCEQELIDMFPGWDALGDMHYMKQRLYRQQRRMLLIQDEKAPTYLTLVLLARTYVAERRRRGPEKIRLRYEELYPKTLNAISTMPRVHDKEQTEILRSKTSNVRAYRPLNLTS